MRARGERRRRDGGRGGSRGEEGVWRRMEEAGGGSRRIGEEGRGGIGFLVFLLVFLRGRGAERKGIRLSMCREARPGVSDSCTIINKVAL